MYPLDFEEFAIIIGEELLLDYSAVYDYDVIITVPFCFSRLWQKISLTGEGDKKEKLRAYGQNDYRVCTGFKTGIVIVTIAPPPVRFSI